MKVFSVRVSAAVVRVPLKLVRRLTGPLSSIVWTRLRQTDSGPRLKVTWKVLGITLWAKNIGERKNSRASVRLRTRLMLWMKMPYVVSSTVMLSAKLVSSMQVVSVGSTLLVLKGSFYNVSVTLMMYSFVLRMVKAMVSGVSMRRLCGIGIPVSSVVPLGMVRMV